MQAWLQAEMFAGTVSAAAAMVPASHLLLAQAHVCGVACIQALHDLQPQASHVM